MRLIKEDIELLDLIKESSTGLKEIFGDYTENTNIKDIHLLSQSFIQILRHNNEGIIALINRVTTEILRFKNKHREVAAYDKIYKSEISKQNRNIILKELVKDSMNSINYMYSNDRGRSHDISYVDYYKKPNNAFRPRLKDIYKILTDFDTILEFEKSCINFSDNKRNFVLVANDYVNFDEPIAGDEFSKRPSPLNIFEEIGYVLDGLDLEEFNIFSFYNSDKNVVRKFFSEVTYCCFHYIGHSTKENLIFRTRQNYYYFDLISNLQTGTINIINSCYSSGLKDVNNKKLCLITYDAPLHNVIGTRFAKNFYNEFGKLYKEVIYEKFIKSINVKMYSDYFEDQNIKNYLRSRGLLSNTIIEVEESLIILLEKYSFSF